VLGPAIWFRIVRVYRAQGVLLFLAMERLAVRIRKRPPTPALPSGIASARLTITLDAFFLFPGVARCACSGRRWTPNVVGVAASAARTSVYCTCVARGAAAAENS